MHIRITEIVPDGESRKPLVYEFSEGELDICKFQILPERGFYAPLARKYSPEDAETTTKMEEVGEHLTNREIIAEFLTSGVVVKRVRCKVSKYTIEDDPVLGVVERIFLTREY